MKRGNGFHFFRENYRLHASQRYCHRCTVQCLIFGLQFSFFVKNSQTFPQTENDFFPVFYAVDNDHYYQLDYDGAKVKSFFIKNFLVTSLGFESTIKIH